MTITCVFREVKIQIDWMFTKIMISIYVRPVNLIRLLDLIIRFILTMLQTHQAFFLLLSFSGVEWLKARDLQDIFLHILLFVWGVHGNYWQVASLSQMLPRCVCACFYLPRYAAAAGSSFHSSPGHPLVFCVKGERQWRCLCIASVNGSCIYIQCKLMPFPLFVL